MGMSIIWPDNSETSQMAIKMKNAKSSNDKDYWTIMREVFLHDFNTLDKDRFKVWASTLSVPIVSNSRPMDYIRISLDAVAVDKTYADALQENFIGCTMEDFNRLYRVFSDSNISMNRMQHLSHLLIGGWNIDKLKTINSIVEIGAGIGEMTDIVYKLGFSGTYTIMDFPEVSNIQRYMHEKAGLNKVSYITNPEDFPVVDLGIATWSFTEMPLDLREKLVDQMAKTNNWIIAYSNDIFGINNDDYINNVFVPKFNDHHIRFVDVPFMPWDGGTKYLFINKK
jgi:hypothetical protein